MADPAAAAPVPAAVAVAPSGTGVPGGYPGAAVPGAVAAPAVAQAVPGQPGAVVQAPAAVPGAVVQQPGVVGQQGVMGQQQGMYGQQGGMYGQQGGMYGQQGGMYGQQGGMYGQQGGQYGQQQGMMGQPGMPGPNMAPQFNFSTVIKFIMEMSFIMQGASMIGMMAKGIGSQEDSPMRKIAGWLWGKAKQSATSAVSMVPVVGASARRSRALANSGTLDSVWAAESVMPPRPGPGIWVWLGTAYFIVSAIQEYNAYRRILSLPVGAPAPPPPPPTAEELAAAEAAKGPHPPRALAGATIAPPPPMPMDPSHNAAALGVAGPLAPGAGVTGSLASATRSSMSGAARGGRAVSPARAEGDAAGGDAQKNMLEYYMNKQKELHAQRASGQVTPPTPGGAPTALLPGADASDSIVQEG